MPSPTAIPANKGFVGWYKEADCTHQWDIASDTVTADITLYAKWRNIAPLTPLKPVYTVTFNTRNLTSPLDSISVIENPLKSSGTASFVAIWIKFCNSRPLCIDEG